MALLHLKQKLTILLLFTFIYFETFSQLPICKDSFPNSLLLNNSFEQYSGCFTSDYGGTLEGGLIDESPNTGGVIVPGWHSLWKTTNEIPYHNYNCRLHTSLSIFDSSIFCHAPVKVPTPLPDGLGFIELGESSNNGGC